MPRAGCQGRESPRQALMLQQSSGDEEPGSSGAIPHRRPSLCGLRPSLQVVMGQVTQLGVVQLLSQPASLPSVGFQRCSRLLGTHTSDRTCDHMEH